MFLHSGTFRDHGTGGPDWTDDRHLFAWPACIGIKTIATTIAITHNDSQVQRWDCNSFVNKKSRCYSNSRNAGKKNTCLVNKNPGQSRRPFISTALRVDRCVRSSILLLTFSKINNKFSFKNYFIKLRTTKTNTCWDGTLIKP